MSNVGINGHGAMRIVLLLQKEELITEERDRHHFNQRKFTITDKGKNLLSVSVSDMVQSFS